MQGEQVGEVRFPFSGRIIEWRGPAPFHFVRLDDAAVRGVREHAPRFSYGWGVVAVMAESGGIQWKTSLFPKEGGYLLPVKDAVRGPAGWLPGDRIEGILRLVPRSE
ncbi:MAG: DUF1905 domain-containing protein [Armatimonadota bacterium]